jgi:hypothetical protein
MSRCIAIKAADDDDVARLFDWLDRHVTAPPSALKRAGEVLGVVCGLAMIAGMVLSFLVFICYWAVRLALWTWAVL